VRWMSLWRGLGSAGESDIVDQVGIVQQRIDRMLSLRGIRSRAVIRTKWLQRRGHQIVMSGIERRDFLASAGTMRRVCRCTLLELRLIESERMFVKFVDTGGRCGRVTRLIFENQSGVTRVEFIHDRLGITCLAQVRGVHWV